MVDKCVIGEKNMLLVDTFVIGGQIYYWL